MKHASSTQKMPQTTTRLSSPDASAGPNGIAIAPPAYGMDVVDHQPVQATPQHKQEYQALESVTWPAREEAIQRRTESPSAGSTASAGPQENRTGLPDKLKAGIETLSGLSMNDVRVHYNSAKPAQLQASAYTQGTEIHMGPGQERHLPHEAWHVVQQKLGRVKPTMQMAGAQINDDDRLEREADVMGMKALQMKFLRNSVAENKKGNKKGLYSENLDHRNTNGVVQMRTWGEWITDVWEMTTSSLWGWMTDIPTRLQNIFIDLPTSLVTELSPLIGYIGAVAAGQNVGANLGAAAATLIGASSRAALRLVFGVLDFLPLTPIFEIINVAVNEQLRPMNGGEIAAANWTYGARPDLWSRVRVSHDDQFLLRVFSYIAGGGNWNAFIGLATYHMIRLQNLGNANANLQNTVHELGHMVQFDQRGATYTMAEAAAHGAIGGYDYNYANLGNPLTSFNREQQCRIGEHGWAVNHGGYPNDYLGSLPGDTPPASLGNVQAAYNARRVQWQANQF